MRFKHSKDGDSVNWQTKFAWFPVSIFDDNDRRWYTIWFERYLERKTYTVRMRYTGFGINANIGKWEYEKKLIDKKNQ
jgi:hypothetical protein